MEGDLEGDLEGGMEGGMEGGVEGGVEGGMEGEAILPLKIGRASRSSVDLFVVDCRSTAALRFLAPKSLPSLPPSLRRGCISCPGSKGNDPDYLKILTGKP
jgi:hypothetical protein